MTKYTNGLVPFDSVKFIVVGNPRKFKTTVANRAFNSVFETDGLREETYNLTEFDLTKHCIIIGGKFYKKWWKKLYIVHKLKKQLKNTYIMWFR